MSVGHTVADAGHIDGNASIVSGPRRLQLSTWQKVGVAVLVAFVFLAFIWIDYMLSTKEGSKPPEISAQSTEAYQGHPPSLSPSPTPVVPPSSELPSGTVMPQSAAGQQSEVVPQIVPASSSTTQGMSPAENAIFAYMGNPAGNAAPTNVSTSQAAPASTSGTTDNSDSLSARLKPTILEGGKASLLPHPDLLLTKGTIIPCTLQTAINTDLAGLVKCVLPEAVRSTTGNVVLLDRGSTIIGEIQTAPTTGQQRVFVLWDRVETPQHVIVSLTSPGADELGRPGVTGSVNDHFGKRFGDAILLSVIQGALQAGSALAGNSGGGGGTYFNSFQTNGQQLANGALQSSMNIPPTIEKSQGSNISIFVIKDIDFSDVYRLAPTQ